MRSLSLKISRVGISSFGGGGDGVGGEGVHDCLSGQACSSC